MSNLFIFNYLKSTCTLSWQMNFKAVIYSVISYPFLNISANRRNAVLIKIGNGYLSKRLGNRTTDSH
jgi:hypothetical protein